MNNVEPSTNDDPWNKIAKYRDLLEEIVAQDGPLAPEARRLLKELDDQEGSQ